MKIALVVAAGVLGCVSAPRTVAPPREPTLVSAPSSKTWDAVVDVFAENSVPIATMERASGLVVAETMSLTPDFAGYADCGSSLGLGRAPTQADLNIRVRGDSSRSTVQASVRWVLVRIRGGYSEPEVVECTSRGTYEAWLESTIKARAEGSSPTVRRDTGAASPGS